MKRLEILIFGSAGKGSLWLGRKISQLFLKFNPEKYATFLAEYQSGVRAGKSRVQVVLFNKVIDNPFVLNPDIEIDLDKSLIIDFGKKILLKPDNRVNEEALSWFRKKLKADVLKSQSNDWANF